MRDNASNVTSLINAFKSSLETFNPLVNSLGDIRCLGYIINLVVSSFLKELAIDYSIDDIEANTQVISTSSK